MVWKKVKEIEKIEKKGKKVIHKKKYKQKGSSKEIVEPGEES